MENLRIPYGLNETGELISAELAEKGKKHTCPCCGIQLVHRAGEVRTKHFAHPPSSNCSYESVLHITAKKLIQSVILKNATAKQTITLENHCHSCGVVFSTSLPMGTFSNAGLENKDR